MDEWVPHIPKLGKPRYLAIADAIAEDIRSGTLLPADRLPPQRKLASRLDIDFTTVARGYVEAKRRGLVEFARRPGHVRACISQKRAMRQWCGIPKSSICR